MKEKSSGIELLGKIKNKAKDKIYIEIYRNLDKWTMNELYNITFQINRTGYQLQHCALSSLIEHKLFSVLIQNKEYKTEHQSIVTAKKNLPALNEEQAEVVETILNGKYHPLPYFYR